MYDPIKDDDCGLTAVSCHSFAGAFTLGVRDAGFRVNYQLEHLGFGYDTARRLNPGIEIVHGESCWPCAQEATFLFGNPRCNSFSALASVANDTGRGCWGYQTQDIHQLCQYGVRERVPFIAWESLQAAYVAGRPLARHLRDTLFWPNGYRIAHVLMNAATHGNSQCRRRYFFVAFPAELSELSIEVSPLSGVDPEFVDDTLRDHRRVRALQTGRADNVVFACDYNSDEVYGPEHFMDLTQDEWHALPHLRQGESLNAMAARVSKERTWHLMTRQQRATWIDRNSEVPFSLHAIKRPRAHWYMPTIYTGTKRLVHPSLDRPFTFGEIASAMGWPIGTVPVGKHPVEQIAKGVVPGCARWLADIVKRTHRGVQSDMAPNTCRDAIKPTVEHVGFMGSKKQIIEEINADPERREIIYDLTWWIPGRDGRQRSSEILENVDLVEGSEEVEESLTAEE